MSIMDNISGMNEYITHQDVIRACHEVQAHEFIMRLPKQYDTLLGDGTLSGGQKQRIALARALVRRTPLLVLVCIYTSCLLLQI